MTDRDLIVLQTWWMGEISTLTKKLIEQEDKRQQRAKTNALKMFGDLSIERREDIDDLYGFGVITDKKREKLIDLWEQTERPAELYQAKLALLQDAYQDAKQIVSSCTNRLNETGGKEK